MFLLTRLACAVAAALVFGASAHAQVAPPGWTLQKSGAEWVASSPDQGRGQRVKLVYKAVQPATGALTLWFPEAHQAVAREFGEITAVGRTDTVAQPGLPRMVASSIAVKVPSGGRAAVIAYAYDTDKGRQMVIILLPSMLSKKNPAYRAAFKSMDEFWAAGQVYVP